MTTEKVLGVDAEKDRRVLGEFRRLADVLAELLALVEFLRQLRASHHSHRAAGKLINHVPQSGAPFAANLAGNIPRAFRGQAVGTVLPVGHVVLHRVLVRDRHGHDEVVGPRVGIGRFVAGLHQLVGLGDFEMVFGHFATEDDFRRGPRRAALLRTLDVPQRRRANPRPAVPSRLPRRTSRRGLRRRGACRRPPAVAWSRTIAGSRRPADGVGRPVADPEDARLGSARGERLPEAAGVNATVSLSTLFA